MFLGKAEPFRNVLRQRRDLALTVRRLIPTHFPPDTLHFLSVILADEYQ
jgi:hypothetical protein